MEVEAPARDENEPELSESSSSSENASCGDSVSAMKSIPMELLSWASNNRATSSSMSTKPLPNGCVNNLLSSTIVRKEDEEESSSESPPDFLKLPGQTNSKYVEAMTNSLKRELLLEQSVKGSPCSDDSTGTGDDSKSAPRRSNRILLTKPKRESRRQQTVPASPSTVIESPSQASEGYVINGDLLDRLNIDDSAFLDEYENKSPQELFDDLPIVGLKKPPFFEPIAERIALSKGKGRKSKSGKAHMDCDCSPDDLEPGEAGCGDNCLNRMLMIEWGTFIMEYVGELLNERQFKTRVKDAAKKGHEHFYFMALTNDAIIDATYKGNVSRFINHSCEPNSETQKWTVNGDLRVGFFSTRKIAPGEEITFDYKFERYGRAAQKCLCGSAKCRGYIGGGDEGDEESGDEDDSDDEETPTQTPVPTPPSTPAQSPPGQQPKKDQTPKKPRERVYRDRELEAQFRRLKKTGLQTKDHVLRCSRLMIRDLTQKKKMDVLEMIREAPISCQKLFLDFHGLRLLWTWLVERGKESKQFHILLREILTTLDVLPIPYLNGLKSSRVLEFVERISGVVFV
ncbi:unnamed protein product [Cyprideis torosa]|uniref:Uncharacterized protein n=1 Tax=Cyprideis torosa TaxID=163714 RepID=A0A7R8WFE3_9CRUS|nr:unnamed protein product [Cyprideis torosa]CAG0890824.1 unnamed protein product [Cyprideis torosa]